ncbi:hypothetical protein [Nocardia carnea]|uniref:hypothetical protein n=1 Tax=Nocardia carnea TaxID=37328 RepID=UPI002455E275|nr:hypothetical protein [Nocardia carnea]
MALSRLAQEFADEIRNHDWSDAPFRFDRAGHSRATDTNKGEEVLTAAQTVSVKENVWAVVTQVLLHRDPNLDIYEFAEACGLDTRTRSGHRDGSFEAAIRFHLNEKRPLPPGKTWRDLIADDEQQEGA